MITCRHIYDHASDYIEGPISLRERLLLLMHLAICKHCRRYTRQLRLVIGMAAGLAPKAEPTDAEIDALAARLLHGSPDPGADLP